MRYSLVRTVLIERELRELLARIARELRAIERELLAWRDEL